MVKLKCKNCGWEWHYAGQKDVYAVCPNCRRIVDIRKEKICVEDDLDKKT